MFPPSRLLEPVWLVDRWVVVVATESVAPRPGRRVSNSLLIVIFNANSHSDMAVQVQSNPLFAVDRQRVPN